MRCLAIPMHTTVSVKPPSQKNTEAPRITRGASSFYMAGARFGCTGMYAVRGIRLLVLERLAICVVSDGQGFATQHFLAGTGPAVVRCRDGERVNGPTNREKTINGSDILHHTEPPILCVHFPFSNLFLPTSHAHAQRIAAS